LSFWTEKKEKKIVNRCTVECVIVITFFYDRNHHQLGEKHKKKRRRKKKTRGQNFYNGE
jgi:hypothetical protein